MCFYISVIMMKHNSSHIFL